MQKQEKLSHVRRAIIKLDTAKIFLQVAWEANALEQKKYIALIEALREPGRMLGGWHNQLLRQNSPGLFDKPGEK